MGKTNVAVCAEEMGITFEGSNPDFATDSLCVQTTYPLWIMISVSSEGISVNT